MEKEWKKLIDDVENDRSYSSEPHFNFLDFIRERGGASYQEGGESGREQS